MKLKILVPFLLFLAFVNGQTHKSYDWRTSGQIQEWPKFNSMRLREHQAATEAYPVKEDFRGYPEPKEVFRGYREPKEDFRGYPEPKEVFRGYPEPSPYIESSFPSELQNVPYGDQSISVSYDSYGEEPRQQLNMTTARIGGFAGSGDTRGYGAYDFPKNNYPEPLDHPEPEPFGSSFPSGLPQMHRELSDLLKINRNHQSGRPDPMLIHTL